MPIVVVLFLRAFAPGAAEFYATLGGEILLLVCALSMGASGYLAAKTDALFPEAGETAR